MEMPDLHRRVLDAALEMCGAHGLVLAGGYAMRAHGLVDRASQDLDFATFTAASLDEATDDLAGAYRAAGFLVERLAARLCSRASSSPTRSPVSHARSTS